jgi:hypothetical protein
MLGKNYYLVSGESEKFSYSSKIFKYLPKSFINSSKILIFSKNLGHKNFENLEKSSYSSKILKNLQKIN